MTEELKKYLLIGIAIVCLSIGGIIMYRSFSGGSSGTAGGNRDIALMCSSCGGFEIPVDEFRELMSSQGPMGRMMPGQQNMAMKCPKCSNKTCYMAQKCQQCENIYVFGQARDQKYPDRCPKCSFSMIEDRQKKPTP